MIFERILVPILYVEILNKANITTLVKDERREETHHW